MNSSDSSLASTGIEGLDAILGGGLTPHRLYLIEGTPGSGKTTLALQFLRAGEPLREFRGVLTGVPVYDGQASPLFKGQPQ